MFQFIQASGNSGARLHASGSPSSPCFPCCKLSLVHGSQMVSLQPHCREGQNRCTPWAQASGPRT